jgi:hypothetical protein
VSHELRGGGEFFASSFGSSMPEPEILWPGHRFTVLRHLAFVIRPVPA